MANYYYADVKCYLSTDSTATAASLKTQVKTTPIKTNTLWYVFYIIDVYLSTTATTFAAWKTAYDNNTSGKGTLVSTTGAGGPAGFKLTIDLVSNSVDTNVVQGKSSNDDSHWKTSFSRKGGTTSSQVTCTPTVAIQWKSTASPNWTPITGIYWHNPSLTPPPIIWSTVKKPPTWPDTAVAAATGAVMPNTRNGAVDKKIKEYAWDQCINMWAFVVHLNSKNLDTLWYCDENGTQGSFSQGYPGPSVDDLSTKAKIAAWSTKNYAKFRLSKQNENCSDQGSKQDVATPPPTLNSRWNPPPHRDARSNSFFEKLEKREYENDKFNAPLPAFKDFNRGYIYQDVNGAATLNKNPDKLADLVDIKTAQRLWGFKFMYNPTTFSYSTASNNSVDWTLGSSDPATLLAGNSNVTFEVYINRIPDLKYLRLKNPTLSEEMIYSRKGGLTQIERDGILNRGTEYDIEFLYRVLNGDPLKQSMLLNYDGVTSDFGYTTGVPCWLVLNENLRYFGSVASFQVNHAMFDLNMVPMLSTVSITFSRYPALWNDKALGSATSANSIHNFLANNGKAPGGKNG